MIEKLISVLVPAYNHEQYIQETIRSVIGQSYKNIELIILDDGSSDKTLEKIKELESECNERFVRFEYSSQKNSGRISTFNSLLFKAKGEYIAYIASDDKYMPDALSLEAEALDRDDSAVLAVGINYFIDGSSRRCFWDSNKKTVYDESKAKWLSLTDMLSETRNIDLTSDDFGKYPLLIKNCHVPNGYLIRKTAFDKIGPYVDEAPLEDNWLMFQLSKYGRFIFINKPTFLYRWHDTNTMKQVAYIKEIHDITLKYERSLYVNEPEDGMTQSYLSYRENYLKEAVTSFDTLHKEFVNRQILDEIMLEMKKSNIVNAFLYCANDMSEYVLKRMELTNYKVLKVFDMRACDELNKLFSCGVEQFTKDKLIKNSCIIICSQSSWKGIKNSISSVCSEMNIPIFVFNPYSRYLYQ